MKTTCYPPKTFPPSHCPQCGALLELYIWGNGWDWDLPVKPCPNCGYDDFLDTMTGTDPDGTVWQQEREDED